MTAQTTTATCSTVASTQNELCRDEPDPIHTPLTALLGTRYPIVQAGMSWASSTSALPLAVSRAGGLGVLAAGPMRLPDLQTALDALREGTQRPWAVNVPLYRKQIDDVLNLLLQAPPPVLIASQGSPRAYLERFAAAGTVCLHVVASVKHARKAADLGVDGLVVVGGEAGGHPPADLVSTAVQVRRIARELPEVPLVASGGFVDGAGLAAALCLGAAGAQFGTRFLASPQAAVHQSYQQLVIDADVHDTITVGQGLGVIRALSNDFTTHMVQAESRGLPPADRAADFAAATLRQAALDGDVINGKVEAGQSAGLVDQVMDAGDIVREIAAQYHDVVAGLPGR